MSLPSCLLELKRCRVRWSWAASFELILHFTNFQVPPSLGLPLMGRFTRAVWPAQHLLILRMYFSHHLSNSYIQTRRGPQHKITDTSFSDRFFSQGIFSALCRGGTFLEVFFGRVKKPLQWVFCIPSAPHPCSQAVHPQPRRQRSHIQVSSASVSQELSVSWWDEPSLYTSTMWGIILAVQSQGIPFPPYFHSRELR